MPGWGREFHEYVQSARVCIQLVLLDNIICRIHAWIVETVPFDCELLAGQI